MTESIWNKTVSPSQYSTLDKDINVEAAVIGGGLCGILTAYYLQKAGIQTVVLEGSRIGSGQSQNTTAKITSQHGLIYHRLLEQFGEKPAYQYAQANQRAIEEYRKLIKERRIDCDFEPDVPAWLYSTTDSAQLKREYDAAIKCGLEAELSATTELPFEVESALCFNHQARFHPLKFLQSIAKDLTIYEQTNVLSVDKNTLVTDRGNVTAKKIIFACHYPFVNAPGYYFMRMHQERSYVLALENAAQYSGMYLGIDTDGLSFRPYGDILLLGGGNHRTGENSAGGQYQRLREAAERYYPGSREIASWSAQDCMTLDGVPYIGSFSHLTPDWYIATGFEKWGMSTSMVAALALREWITDGSCPWAEVFSPLRFTPSASAKTLMQESAQATKGLTRKLFTPPRTDIETLPNGHGGVVEYDGEKVGVYKDENGEAFIVSIRCPHLGCQLEWNPDEKSWDCPCHGSRFDYRGNLLDNPAQQGLEHA